MCVFAHLCSLGANKIMKRGKKYRRHCPGKNVPNAVFYSRTFFLNFAKMLYVQFVPVGNHLAINFHN
jgi:hypothetical protein